ncbi:dihydrofolate reductase family protein [Haloechinothrix halophila]|uniref:dihydrofolate reductase family protein n=1 Tax=Haloechinothrix halophila TaxID=1069073 RepID=UPI0003FAD4B9|nr:dihydrofolate reductase family protein [Haloechinothrix halophila]
MGKLIIDITMSLDGFIAAPKDRPDEPLGEGGLRLHNWLTTDRTDVESTVLEQSAPGAIISGRRTYDNSKPWWGVGKGPAGSTPVFVVSHGVDEEGLGDGSPFMFVDGIESALEQARRPRVTRTSA